MNAKPQRQRLDPAKRAELILDAALGLFGTSHYSIVTVREIAVACGVNVGLIYHYFENKDHLFRSVLAHSINQIMAGYAASCGSLRDDPLGEIGAWLDIQATIAPTVTRMVKIMADYAALDRRDPEVDSLVAQFYEHERVLIEETLVRGIEDKTYRHVDVAKMSRMIGVYLDGIFHAAESRGENRIAEDIKELRELVLNLLTAPQRALG
ncbi:TetR/AcrR family transcriptional regulator [Sinorhizobium sp. BG8]|uniref:TetR/AcrR family transcriptional regulator n=1 Tax=Sinorhizobium sp. BG8 TaxID=2613773 RepID=UPI00193E3BBC|nr:TetR/AcrR family transcriptional regulator [Sinorhizobium sp. BG8]QRM53188.1 TetR/AcrR family transcriptional regulator [Sinorhizobium sp. BG8]